MTISKTIDMLIQYKKNSGVNSSARQYSEFLNLKAKLTEIKIRFGCFNLSQNTLKYCQDEYFSEYVPNIPSLEYRQWVWNELVLFIEVNNLC